METLLQTYPAKHFAGIIVGNEVLFREDLTETALAANLSSVRQTLSDLAIDLPVATSDLGDDWTAALAADSDIVLANVHPFFAGVTPAAAPGWTWDFWQNHNVGLKTAPSSEGKGWPGSIIAEVGWPSEGGTNCGGTDGSCASGEEGAVAGVEELNEFMEGWVCPSMENGTVFFW
jgi:exo-beta-1,3-glucanase (GH17 family)